MTVDALAEVEGGVFVAFQVDQGGCNIKNAKGLFFWLLVGQGKWTVTTDLGGCTDTAAIVHSPLGVFCCPQQWLIAPVCMYIRMYVISLHHPPGYCQLCGQWSLSI